MFWLAFIIVVLAIILVCKLFRISLSTICKLIINIVVGLLVIWLLNFIPGVDIPFTWWSGLIVGVFGLPGTIIMLVISFFI